MLFIAYKVSIVGLYTIHTDKRFGRDSVEVRFRLRNENFGKDSRGVLERSANRLAI